MLDGEFVPAVLRLFASYGREAVESAALLTLGYPVILVTEPGEVQRLNLSLCSR